MTELLLHPQTKLQIEHFIKNPVQALIIEGPKGSGKTRLAQNIASRLLDVNSLKLETAGNVLHIKPTNNAISINEIRSIQQFLKLKSLGQNPIKRILLVYEAQKLTIEAQNAFLKILEEPPADTVIILTTPNRLSILATIQSRSQYIKIKSLTKEIMLNYFKDPKYTSAQLERAYHLSGGQVGQMQSILDGSNSIVSDQILLAKKLLGMSIFERLTQVDELAKHKGQAVELLQAIEVICQSALNQAVNNKLTANIKRWHRALTVTVKAQTDLQSQPNMKLFFTNLLINL